MNEPLHISEIHEIDFAGIREVNLDTAQVAVVLIKGPNGSGKSSLLNGLLAAIGGAKLDPPEPIRLGAPSARVRLKLADRIAARWAIDARWWWADEKINRKLDLIEIDGQKMTPVKSPQSRLLALVGSVSIDPLALLRVTKATDQARALMTAAGKLDEYEALAKAALAARAGQTHANKEWDNAKGHMEISQDPDHGQEVQPPPDTKALSSQIAQADAAARVVSDWQRDRAALNAQVQQLQAQLQQAQAKLAAHEQTPPIRPPDVSAQRQALADAGAAATKYAARQTYLRAEAAVKSAEKVREQRQAEVKAADAALRAAASACGVEGITVEADGTARYHDIPLEQCSTSERTRICARVMMQQPREAKLALIDQGDAMDPDSMAALCEEAEAHQYQVLMTCVYADPPADSKSLVVKMTKPVATGKPDNAPKGAGEPAAAGPSSELDFGDL